LRHTIKCFEEKPSHPFYVFNLVTCTLYYNTSIDYAIFSMLVILFFITQFFKNPIVETPSVGGLRVVFTNIKTVKGQILVGIYDAESAFLNTNQVKVKRYLTVTAKGSMTLDLADLPAGNYAISCFHDINGNGELDTNLVGIPSEPYAFSNNARPKFRAPHWSEAQFWLDANGKQIDLRLEKW
jgi:uncharacterized protein (DUF2141 family)